MTLNVQHACYPLLPHESMTWATFRRHMSTPNITQHTLPYLTVLHQISPEWSRMGSCQTRCLLPILINPDPTVYGSCSFSGKQWKTSTSKNRGPWTAVLGGSCSDSEVSPCRMAIRAVEEWALWCYVMLWYALYRDAFQSFPTRVYETCTVYKKNQIKSKNDMASQHLTHWSHHISPGLHAPRLHLQSHF